MGSAWVRLLGAGGTLGTPVPGGCHPWKCLPQRSTLVDLGFSLLGGGGGVVPGRTVVQGLRKECLWLSCLREYSRGPSPSTVSVRWNKPILD